MDNLREKVDDTTLETLDSVAQIVAKLYQEETSDVELLGNEPSELRSAVYNLGKAYMYLYNLLLEELPDEAVENEKKD